MQFIAEIKPKINITLKNTFLFSQHKVQRYLVRTLFKMGATGGHLFSYYVVERYPAESPCKLDYAWLICR